MAKRVAKGPSNLRVLAGHFGEARWREVIRLFVAMAPQPVFEAFMTEVVAAQRLRDRQQLTSLCLREAHRPSEGPFVAALRDPGQRLAALQALSVLREITPQPLQRLAERINAQPKTFFGVHELKGEERDALFRLTGQMQAGVRVNPIDGTELVLIAEGPFIAGDPNEDDNPRREISPKSYYLSKFPVTNAQYKKFLDDHEYFRKKHLKAPDPPESWSDDRYNQPEQPVVTVSWHDAVAYCDWAELRLPNEWEWEKGARGTDGRPYPWGKPKPAKTRANYNMNVGQPTPVGSYPAGASPYGLMDMAGNVWEWTASEYTKGKTRTVRGGAFDDQPQLLRAAFRLYVEPGTRDNDVGFRCAQDPVKP